MKINKLTLIALIGLLLVGCNETKDNNIIETEEPINVRAIKLETQDFQLQKSYFGKLRYSKNMTYVADLSGRLSQLYFKPGQEVQKGEVVLSYPPQNHHIQIEQVRLGYNELKDNYERQKKLYDKGAVSRVALNELKVQMDIQEKTLQQLKSVNQITAPFTGVITEVFPQEGDEILPGTALFSMAKTDNIQTEFFVPSDDIPSILLGGEVTLIYDSLRIKGKITQRAIQIDANRRAFRVIASFPMIDQLHVSGITVEIKVNDKLLKDIILIPNEAIVKIGRSEVVFIAENGTAKRKSVLLGDKQELHTIVKKGIKTGDFLIVNGVEKIQNNSPIQLVK